MNQIRLTNVAVVRLKKGGKRFEIACFPNTVASWRNGVEKDIDEVVQTHEIFTNVSQGVVAKKDELQMCFKTSDQEKILLTILKQGEIQVTEKERQAHRKNLFNEIATIVAGKCVDSDTQKPLTVNYVESAMKDLHYNPNPSKPAKVQALEVITLLQDKLPIMRAQMRIQVEIPGKDAKAVADKLRPFLASIERDEFVYPKLYLVTLLYFSSLLSLLFIFIGNEVGWSHGTQELSYTRKRSKFPHQGRCHSDHFKHHSCCWG